MATMTKRNYHTMMEFYHKAYSMFYAGSYEKAMSSASTAQSFHKILGSDASKRVYSAMKNLIFECRSKF